MFGGGEASCSVRVAVGSGLATGRCGCPGYTSDAAASAESVGTVDVLEPRLRRPGDPRPAESPPVRDLYAEDRHRLRDLDELEGVPWRPPS